LTMIATVKHHSSVKNDWHFDPFSVHNGSFFVPFCRLLLPFFT
jgi:hypothetical protein